VASTLVTAPSAFLIRTANRREVGWTFVKASVSFVAQGMFVNVVEFA
jgi:hypothetical protein